MIYIYLDPELMVVPIDERMINRSHGVFDSMSIIKFRFFRVCHNYLQSKSNEISFNSSPNI